VASILQTLSDSCAEREDRADAVKAMTVGNSSGSAAEKGEIFAQLAESTYIKKYK